jgi:hypothetical protein
VETRKLVVLLSAVAALGLALAAMAYGLVGPLRADIASALVAVEPVDPQRGWNITHDVGPSSDSLIGAGVVLFGLSIVGVPLALAALALAARTRHVSIRWSRWWGGFFTTGFIVQLSSLILTGCLTVMFATSIDEDSFWGIAFLLVSTVCSAFGVQAWRSLQAAVVHEVPLSVTE